MIKERPILFSAPMVRAILDGRKTQTRRIIKPQPSPDFVAPEEGLAWREGAGICGRQRVMKMGVNGEPDVDVDVIDFPIKPRFTPGDRLWVRETWAATGTGVWTIADARRQIAPDQRIVYKADDYASEQGIPASALVDGWWPSIHMPREFSRILLEIADIRVERVQDISREDAIAEGTGLYVDGHGFITERELRMDPGYSAYLNPRGGFEAIWSEINGRDSWHANPFVWAISFHRIQQERAAA